MTSPLLDTALTFAARAHASQKRKATDVPYIVHPVGVLLILMEAGETDPELLAAALLHDTVEDTGTTLADLQSAFGPNVAAIVAGCSEPSKREHAWEVRKQHTIEALKSATRAVQLVSAADKLHNVRVMQADYARLGAAVWARFNRGPEQIAWYYRTVAATLRAGAYGQHPVMVQLQAVGSVLHILQKRKF